MIFFPFRQISQFVKRTDQMEVKTINFYYKFVFIIYFVCLRISGETVVDNICGRESCTHNCHATLFDGE